MLGYLSFLLVVAATSWLFAANYISPPVSAEDIVVALILLIGAIVTMFVREGQERIR